VLEEQAKRQQVTMQQEKKQLVLEPHTRKRERQQQETKVQQLVRELLPPLAKTNHQLWHNQSWL